MHLVNEKYRPFLFLQLREHHLEALLEVAPILGARQQRAKVEGVDGALGHHVRHLRLDNALGQTLRDGGFADPGLAHQQRIVLASAAQHLDDPFEFLLPAHERVDAASLGLLV